MPSDGGTSAAGRGSVGLASSYVGGTPVGGFGFPDTNLFNVRGMNNSVLARILPILLMLSLSYSIVLSIACIFRIAHSWTAGLDALFTPLSDNPCRLLQIVRHSNAQASYLLRLFQHPEGLCQVRASGTCPGKYGWDLYSRVYEAMLDSLTVGGAAEATEAPARTDTGLAGTLWQCHHAVVLARFQRCRQDAMMLVGLLRRHTIKRLRHPGPTIG